MNVTLLSDYMTSSFLLFNDSVSELQQAFGLIWWFWIERLEIYWLFVIDLLQSNYLHLVNVLIGPMVKTAILFAKSATATTLEFVFNMRSKGFGYMSRLFDTILGLMDVQACILIVLVFNMVLLGFLIFQKSTLDRQFRFLTEEIQRIRIGASNQEEDIAPIALLPQMSAPPPPPPPLPNLMGPPASIPFKRSLPVSKKPEPEAPSTMTSVLEELLQVKRRVLTMITTPRKAYLDRKTEPAILDQSDISPVQQPNLFKRPEPLDSQSSCTGGKTNSENSENEDPKPVIRRSKKHPPLPSTGTRRTVMTRNQKKQAVIEQAGKVAKERLTATYTPSIKSPLRSSFSSPENIQPPSTDIFVPKESTLQLMDELRKGVNLNRTHIPMSPGGTTFIFNQTSKSSSGPRTYTEQIMDSLKVKFAQAYGVLTPAPPKRVQEMIVDFED